MAVVRLTETRVRDLPLGSGIHRDEVVKGLMVICHKTTKTYAVQGDVRRNGRHIRTVRMKLDRADRLGLAEARRRAKALMSQIQSGVDPSARQDETGITVEAALEVHLG
ncbi:MAG: integrase arm-type DNA-binding domain-containing protein, partial [Alphaproteobacteria bacterium]